MVHTMRWETVLFTLKHTHSNKKEDSATIVVCFRLFCIYTYVHTYVRTYHVYVANSVCVACRAYYSMALLNYSLFYGASSTAHRSCRDACIQIEMSVCLSVCLSGSQIDIFSHFYCIHVREEMHFFSLFLSQFNF